MIRLILLLFLFSGCTGIYDITGKDYYKHAPYCNICNSIHPLPTQWNIAPHSYPYSYNTTRYVVIKPLKPHRHHPKPNRRNRSKAHKK